MKNILFVCTGNTCRSSMAEGLFKAMLTADPELGERFTASSAGISAIEGDPANHHSIKTLRENWNIDIQSHRSKFLQEKDVENAYLVLTLTRGHSREIISRYPNAKNKTFTLKEYVNGNDVDPGLKEYNFSLDIMDPYGMSYEVYKSCGEEIKDAVEKLAFKLKNEY